MRVSVIIPSRKAENLIPCVEMLRQHEAGIPVTVVSDGLDMERLGSTWQRENNVEIIEGVKPFIFARNMNIGIRAAQAWYDSDGFILLNDDAQLLTPHGFTRLAEAAATHPDYGVISAVTNYVGNPAQQARNSGFRDEPRTLAFVCVLVTRRAIETVGELDERFTAYGWEDNDFCRRCRLAGLKLGISDLCFVDHGRLHSTFRGAPWTPGDISAGASIYRQKWGDLD